MTTRTIGVVTVGRSDYSIYLPILRAIQEEPALKLHLIVSGAHLSQEFGFTIKLIEADGFTVGSRVEMLRCDDSPGGIVESMGMGLVGFAQSYSQVKPDLLLVAGDRFEMHTAAVAALPFKIPVAHVHGGELSQGAIDDALRHSITKLSHLHFVATPTYARRVIQMGEEPWRVAVCGAPSLDNLRSFRPLRFDELRRRLGLRCEAAPLLVTYHPVTLEYEQAEGQAEELLAALEACELPIVFTQTNADTNGRRMWQRIVQFVQRHPTAEVVENLGVQAYFSLMACAAAMVGNSSSGIVEAPSFGLPVVNVGTRQDGRLKAEHVIDVGTRREAIARGIAQAVSPAFREGLKGLVNPYGDGHAAEEIVTRLKEIPLDDRLIRKRFADGPPPGATPIEHQVGVHVH